MVMFVRGAVLLFDGLLILFLLKEIYGHEIFVPAQTLVGVKLLMEFGLVLRRQWWPKQRPLLSAASNKV
jgi:hypothetical protein